MMPLKANAKVIIAGEHAVLNEGSALVLPLQNLTVIAQQQSNTDKKLLTNCHGAFASQESNALWLSFLQNAGQLANVNLSGTWNLQLSIPIGIGLGFSAAISALTAKMFAQLGYISSTEVFEFAHKLESPLHGISSGCDIAGALAETPIAYKMHNQVERLEADFRPYLAWSQTKTISNTKLQVNKVQKINCQTTKLQMKTAAEQAISAWKNQDTIELATAMNQASLCFKNWDLVSDSMRQQMLFLQKQGALATKPTGAGGGGVILSLWQEKVKLKGLNWIH